MNVDRKLLFLFYLFIILTGYRYKQASSVTDYVWDQESISISSGNPRKICYYVPNNNYTLYYCSIGSESWPDRPVCVCDINGRGESKGSNKKPRPAVIRMLCRSVFFSAHSQFYFIFCYFVVLTYRCANGQNIKENLVFCLLFLYIFKQHILVTFRVIALRGSFIEIYVLFKVVGVTLILKQKKEVFPDNNYSQGMLCFSSHKLIWLRRELKTLPRNPRSAKVSNERKPMLTCGDVSF